MTQLRVLSTMGVHGVMAAFGPLFEAASGVTLDAEFMPTARLLDRIRAGERAEVAILTNDGIDALITEGVLGARTDLARSFIGVAVKAGQPHPDISTADAFIATIMAAPSIALSQAGVSGLYMAGLFERLGLAEPIRAKATILSSGYTATLAASGQVQLAIQQVSELLVVDGIEIVGRLPSSLGGQSVFSAALFQQSTHPAAQALIDALANPAQAEIYHRCGLEPISG